MMSFLGTWPRTSVPCALPSKVYIASSRLPSVADMPQVSNSGLQCRNLAKASWVCTPRLLPSNSCHSSTTTIFTVPSTSRASARESITDRLSGVVTSTVGKRLFCALRSAASVSPLRAPRLQGLNCPSACKSPSTRCSAPSVSAASARIGVIQITVSAVAAAARLNGFNGFNGFCATFLIAACAGITCAGAIKRITIPSQTAYVLPEPVVACSKPDWPCAMAFQTPR